MTRLELLAYAAAVQLVAAVYVTHRWWAAFGLLGLLLVSAGAEEPGGNRSETDT